MEYCIWLVANRHWVVLGIHPKAVDLFKCQKLFLCRLWNTIETLWPRSSLRRYPLASSTAVSLRWRHNSRDGPSDHQRLGCLLSRLFRRRSRKTTKFRTTGLCERNPSVTDGFRSQRASNVENVSMWWRPHNRYFLCPTSAMRMCCAVCMLFVYGNFRFIYRALFFSVNWLNMIRKYII